MKMRKSWRVEVLPLQRGHRRLTWMAAKMQFLQKTWPQRVEKGSRPWTYSMHTGHLYKSEFGVAFDVSGGASVSFEHWNSAQTNFNNKSQISQGTTNHKALHQFLWAPSRLPLYVAFTFGKVELEKRKPRGMSLSVFWQVACQWWQLQLVTTSIWQSLNIVCSYPTQFGLCLKCSMYLNNQLEILYN